ncbi:MAG TPA: hypothetical protein VN622_05855 [Clostridia bacterium]|nr:hypothetical protein [Clostridia bacterium]
MTIQNFAVFITKDALDGQRFMCFPMQESTDLRDLTDTLLENYEWVAYLGIVSVRNGKFPMPQIRKLERNWFNAGSPTKMGKLHPRYAAGTQVLAVIDEVIAPAATKALNDRAKDGHVGLKSLEVTHADVATLRSVTNSQVGSVELTLPGRVVTYRVKQGNLFEVTDDAFFTVRVSNNSGSIVADIVSAEIPEHLLGIQ